MKLKLPVIAVAVLVSGLSLTPNAFAAAASVLPATHTQGEVTYLSGGVGANEANAIKHIAKDYPLELEFVLKAKPKDEYLADVKVQIKDAHDKTVLDATTDGPFLLAKLPAGRYMVSADRDGRVERHRIEIAAKEHRRVVFEWKS
jgi:hypothetical protein